MSAPYPDSTLSTVLELTPLVEKVVAAATAMRHAPVGTPTPLPEIKGVRIGGGEFDVVVTLTRR